MARDHGDVGDGPSVAAPIGAVATVERLTPAEEVRTLVAGTTIGALGTLDEDGGPWTSLVAFGALEDGSPVFALSHLAEHGRNAARDPRASLMVHGELGADPLATGRVTLAGRLHRPEGDASATAAAAYAAAAPTGGLVLGFSDFTLWVLRVERVRWVGGYGRMDTVDASAFAAAAADPVAGRSAGAVAHLNADHADALLELARAFGGHPDAESAVCTGVDRLGIDLVCTGPRGRATPRIGWLDGPLTAASELRAASVALTHAARAALAERA